MTSGLWMLLLVVMVGMLSSTDAQSSLCEDRARKCELWASQGACVTYSKEMSSVCPYSCRLCVPEPDLTFPPPGVASNTNGASQAPPPLPNAGGAIGPAPGVSFARPTITRPPFDCGRPYITTSSSGNSRRVREANPQIVSRQNTDASIVGRPNTPPPPSKVLCGSSLISDRFLITSATCVLDPANPIYSVRLGQLTTSGGVGDTNSRPVDYEIKQITVHPDFDPSSGTRYNDVALLETALPIQFNEYVFPYCISNQVPSPGTTVIGAGFGHVNETHLASHLQEAELKVVESGECEAEYQKAGEEQRLNAAFPNRLQRQDVLCAGFPGRGACKGDEGGPLFTEVTGGRRVLVGIINLTGPCHNTITLPGVYTSVAHHIDFIDSVIYGVH